MWAAIFNYSSLLFFFPFFYYTEQYSRAVSILLLSLYPRAEISFFVLLIFFFFPFIIRLSSKNYRHCSQTLWKANSVLFEINHNEPLNVVRQYLTPSMTESLIEKGSQLSQAPWDMSLSYLMSFSWKELGPTELPEWNSTLCIQLKADGKPEINGPFKEWGLFGRPAWLIQAH